jgi:hypothetical protein
MVALSLHFVPNRVAVEITAKNNWLSIEPFWIGFDGPVNLNDVIVFGILTNLRGPNGDEKEIVWAGNLQGHNPPVFGFTILDDTPRLPYQDSKPFLEIATKPPTVSLTIRGDVNRTPGALGNYRDIRRKTL